MPITNWGREQSPLPDRGREIEQEFLRVHEADQRLTRDEVMMEGKLKNFRVELLRKAYKMLKEAGVDPSNPDSIARFLRRLEQMNPDFVELFEAIFNGLDPDGPQQPAGGPSLMDQNTAPERGFTPPGMPQPGMPEPIEE